ncbi:hypothetical protein SAMN05428975_1364 [Mucilaginibacter sp. OK268]|uniref:hypothetical protein n=1 Tax=Mucilaginibacter sp. OK268 TaxID=1881048 RepID=UPI0008862E3F|nr:hypothetical protein [Mucilaginibacter sp. OK268]SDP47435.1 hypothetical protein SAMN05428975_1364 [Mucilaginibacter sp. OK268]
MEAENQEISNILFLIREYGVIEYIKKHPDRSQPINQDEMLALINEGMKKAQLLLLEKIRLVITEQEQNDAEVKRLRQTAPKEKEPIEELLSKGKLLAGRENLLRSLVNTIVWQMFGGKREEIARFYLEDEGTKSLTGDGFEAVLKAAESINADPHKFALIADLATNMHVGDLITVGKNGYEITEVKTGTKNMEAIQFFQDVEEKGLLLAEEIEKVADAHFKKQLQRMQKQKEVAAKTADILNNDTGVYQRDDNTIVTLHESLYEQENYHDDLIALLEKSRAENHAYTSIDGIVNVGVYREHWLGGLGAATLHEINAGYPLFDIRQTLSVHVVENLFSKPFSQEDINDILTGKIQVLIGINYDQLIEFAKMAGLPLRWSTARELNEVKAASPIKGRELFTHENKGLVIDDGKKKGFIGMAFIIRIALDHLKPTIEILNRLETWEAMNDGSGLEQDANPTV